ncbi:ABC transporter ATP-binding protein [Bradyrhizobium sp. RT11b]|uniref:ABC transporter ATP-binding protein n=1 Tax=Bradyrhizobium sp. RT11b TaxID=3156332 RepID=UPI0033921CF7
MLRLAGVTKTYGTTCVVDQVNLEVDRGNIVALLGPSGCGKTTTLRMIAGFVSPDSGSIELDGRSVVRDRPYERDVGIVFQDYALFPHLSVEQNVAYGPRHRGLSKMEIAKRTQRYLSLVRLEGFEHRMPNTLSGGQQQRVALARALAIEPRVLLLDEPLSALDTKLRVELRGGLRDILVAAGCATIVVTHDQEEAMSLCDRVFVMNAGQIQQQGTPTEIYDRPANEFVASFVGRSNHFSGTIEVRNRRPVFRGVEGFSFDWPFPEDRPGRIEFVIRPERLFIRPFCDSSGTLQGRFRRRLFLGQDEEISVELDGGKTVSVVLRSSQADLPEVGSPIALTFSPADIVRLS